MTNEFSIAKDVAMIQSVVRAFRLLELVDEGGPEGLGLSEIAERAGLKTPTACNLLRTLAELGYVAQDGASRRYRLGSKGWGHGRQQRLGELLREVAAGPAERLRDEWNETVQLAIYRNQHRHTILSLESSHTLRAGSQLGCDDHFYDTATGRVLLAALDSAELDAHVARFGLPGDRWPAAAARAGIQAALATIRDQGWATLDKSAGHLHAQAATVPTAAPDVNAALGIYYPAMRWDPAAEEHLREALVATARAIANAFDARN